MQYLGGKSRIAKPISEILVAAKGERTTYVEPFLGAASVFALAAPHFEHAFGGDVVEDLALMWRAVSQGWEPPSDLTEEHYNALRNAAPSPLRAFAGYACSFGGKWFAGYARNRSGRNYAATAARSIEKRRAGLRGATILRADYRAFDHLIGPDCVVYCDPPYAGTTEYGAAKGFDSEEFWAVMAEWGSRGAAVFVSEYGAPAGWNVAWEKTALRDLRGQRDAKRDAVTERLYTPPPALAMRRAA